MSVIEKCYTETSPGLRLGYTGGRKQREGKTTQKECKRIVFGFFYSLSNANT